MYRNLNLDYIKAINTTTNNLTGAIYYNLKINLENSHKNKIRKN